MQYYAWTQMLWLLQLGVLEIQSEIFEAPLSLWTVCCAWSAETPPYSYPFTSFRTVAVQNGEKLSKEQCSSQGSNGLFPFLSPSAKGSRSARAGTQTDPNERNSLWTTLRGGSLPRPLAWCTRVLQGTRQGFAALTPVLHGSSSCNMRFISHHFSLWHCRVLTLGASLSQARLEHQRSNDKPVLSPGGSSQPMQMKEQCEREHGKKDFNLSHKLISKTRVLMQGACTCVVIFWLNTTSASFLDPCPPSWRINVDACYLLEMQTFRVVNCSVASWWICLLVKL